MKESKKVMLKISGEMFQSAKAQIDFDKYNGFARQVIDIQKETGVQLAIVPGGGNIFRGRQANTEVDSNEADSMGMLATIMNGIGIREALVRNGAPDTRLMTSVPIPAFAEPYIRIKAVHHLENGRIVIFAGGLGMPGFSTDSATAQRAHEMGATIFKATTVDGVYDCDPKKNKNAKMYNKITHRQAINDRLGVMDATAFTMCERTNTPIFVFNIRDLSRLPEIIRGNHSFGTLIEG